MPLEMATVYFMGSGLYCSDCAPGNSIVRTVPLTWFEKGELCCNCTRDLVELYTPPKLTAIPGGEAAADYLRKSEDRG